MCKLFQIIDFVLDEGNIILFCSKDDQEFHIKFNCDRFIDWMRDTDRLNSDILEYYGSECVGSTTVVITEEEYWGNCTHVQYCNDFYEYVVLRLVAGHELSNGTEKALLEIANNIPETSNY